ncbi:hypothetical protein [Stappia indica]|uniref:Uncharacterized protein n=1 Tax=Stappia indica TaxID=538381 RepID=A0A285TSQ1_9HYPH|nr:hypothetical protein [Stappia indica]SOC26958.1 hypothetical protein SAMN05421512_11730 [Stappia indica]
MSSLWIDHRHMRIRKYSAAATGPKAVVRVEIEVSEPGSLGYLLANIGEVQREVEAARTKAKQKPAKPLALPYYGSDGA